MSNSQIKSSQIHHIMLYEFLPPSDGGIAQIAFETGLELHRRGYKTAFCGFGDLFSDSIYKNISIDLWPLPRKGWKKLKDVYLFLTFIRMFIKYGNRVILYSLTWKTARLATALSPLTGWKIVVFASGNEVVRQIGKRKEKLMRDTFRRANVVFPISNYTANRMREIGITNIEVNKVGVNISRFSSLDTLQCKKRLGWVNRKVVLTAARVVARKGQDTVIKALPGIIPEVSNVLYVIAGTGPEQEVARLKELVKETNTEDYVRFIGFFDDALKSTLYSACDVYVMISRVLDGTRDVEGFGITYLEANCCSKPVIGSLSGGIPDAIENGVNGFLIEPEDIKSFSSYLIQLLKDDQLAAEMGIRGRKRVEDFFTWEKYTDRMLNNLKSNNEFESWLR